MRIRMIPQPKPIPLASMASANPFSGTIMGAFGYVRAHRIKTASVRVELLNGTILHSVGVPAREWVCDTAGNKSTGGIDLPPIGSLVFVLFPYGIRNTSGAFVLASFFDYENEKHKEFLQEGEEAKAVTVLEGGLKTTYDRETATYTLEDVDDAKLSIRLDKENKEIVLTDWHDNKATLDADGMVLEGKSNTVTLDADGVTLEGKGNTVSLETGKVVINGNLEVLQ